MIDHQIRSQTEYDRLAAFNVAHLTPSDGIGIKELRLVPSCALTSPRVHDMATLTPPAEKIDMQWGPIAQLSQAPAESAAAEMINSEMPATGVASAAIRDSQPGRTEQVSGVDVSRSCIDGAMDVLRKCPETPGCEANAHSPHSPQRAPSEPAE